jgi:hypothetical protein
VKEGRKGRKEERQESQRERPKAKHPAGGRLRIMDEMINGFGEFPRFTTIYKGYGYKSYNT